MQLDVEMSPPAFVRAHLERESTCSVLGVYTQCRLNVGCITNLADNISNPQVLYKGRGAHFNVKLHFFSLKIVTDRQIYRQNMMHMRPSCIRTGGFN